MNDTRRKAIDAIKARLPEIAFLLTQAKELADEISEEIGNLQGEEQDYLDAMPESLQNGEKGEKAQAAIDALGEAMDALGTIADEVENISMDDVESALDTAKE
jgi:methyl-accepting chemotaxis protein